MNGYPYLPVQPNEQQKKNALTNALLGSGQAMVQPAQGTSGIHKLLTALAQSIPAGIGNYGQSLQWDYDLQQQHLDTMQNRAYKDSYMDYQDLLSKQLETNMAQEKAQAEWEANEQKRWEDFLKSPFTSSEGKPSYPSLEDAVIAGDEGAIRKLAVATIRRGDKGGLKGILSLLPEGATPKNASDARIYAEYILSGDPNKRKLAEGMITYKRTQPPEAGAVQRAKRQADIETAAPLGAEKVKGEGKIPEVDKKANARRQVTGTLDNLFKLYIKFDDMGAAVSTDKSALSNLKNWAGATGAGQLGGKMLGTEAQSVRNQINQSRPLLLNYIRQASEMGARGLDSEKELEFYLQAATDPARDIAANLAAIAVLDEAYGEASREGVTSKFRKNLKQLKNEFKKVDKQKSKYPPGMKEGW
jgi:hypothetical protein